MERENVTITYSEKVNKVNLNKSLDKIIFDSLNILIDGVIKADNPKRLEVEIHVEDEYGEDLPHRVIFDRIEKEFEKNKSTTGLDFCRMWKINEYIIVIGVKQ